MSAKNGWIVPPGGAITEHFTWHEAACRCCGRVPSVEAVRKTAALMEEVRKELGGLPLHVASWCRCPAHNAAVGGAKESYHLRGMAVDFTVKLLSPERVQERLKGHEGGLGRYAGFTHVDRGPRRRWEG